MPHGAYEGKADRPLSRAVSALRPYFFRVRVEERGK
jgi:hypothetical protein